MGFCNSVSIAQHVHRNVVKWATQSMQHSIGAEGELRRDKGFPLKQDLYRIYLDNFDQLELVDARTAALIQGTVSDQVLQLRQTYEVLQLPRHPKKAVQRSLRAEVQGALLLGDVGVAIPKPAKVLQYVALALELLRMGQCTLRELQVVCGGFVYLTSFRKPLLSALNHVWVFMEALKWELPVVRRKLPEVVVVELVRFLCLVPCAQMFFGCKVSPVVTCSDASQDGGGMCATVGVTPYGARAAQANVRGDIPEAHDWSQVLSVGLFDGIAALRVACDILQLPMAGHISIETNPEARRVVEAFFPDSLFHDNVCTIDKEMVQQFALRFSNVGVVLIGAGPPCQGVSQLNFDRRGALKDHRSALFAEVPRVSQLFRECFPWAQIHDLMENVASMTDEDSGIMSSAVGSQPWQIDSLGLTICRRPRLYWITWELYEEEDVTITPPSSSEWTSRGSVHFNNKVDPKDLLQEGWELAGSNLPTFTTARPSSKPGRKPAGLLQCSPQELELWRQDRHRFPPYQYSFTAGLTNKRGQWRLPSVEEREACMGFPVGYTKLCVPKTQQSGVDFEDKRMSLLGNSWQVGVVAWLLQHLFVSLGMINKLSLQELVQRLCPGQGHSLQAVLLRPPLNPQRHTPQPLEAVSLVPRLLGIASIKGEDLLLQSSTELAVKFHRLRASIPARLWRWKEIAGWAWRGSPEHINGLEMRAIHTCLRWWILKKKAVSVKFLHLTDSLVCLHALSRGRTSSRKLRKTTMRINSLLLGADLHPIWGYVHTSQNPADKPSRRVRFVKKKWVK
eukprot:Skav214937  [mRNA]  locus=scaffold3017:99733:102105:- [translate_table: standard]